MNRKCPFSRALIAAAAVALVGATTGCTTTNPNTPADAVARGHEISAAVDGALTRLRTQEPSAAEMLQRAHGVLVFPRVVSAGLVVGGSYGQGELRVNGRHAGYYSTTAAAGGLLAGAESKAVYLLFMTEEALQRFQASKGWTAGVDASVSVLRAGANVGVDTQTMRQPVVGYVLTNAGLMANVSIDGTRIARIDA
jgi:lipid-binding SYLF domain-containing protein